MENHINWNEVEGHWNDYKDRVKDNWCKLTEDDLKEIKGDRHRLLSALQERYGMAKDKVEQQVSEFFAKAGDWIEETKDKVADAAKRGKQYFHEHSVTDITADIQQLIIRNPIRSTLVGIGVGYFVGRYLTGSYRS